MSDLTYSGTIASWCCPGGQTLPVTGAGVYEPIPGWLHETVYSGSIPVEDDASMGFLLQGRYVVTNNTQAVYFRLRDITNGVTVLGPSTVPGGWWPPMSTIVSSGPLGTWPAGDAALRIEYSTIGTGVISLMYVYAMYTRAPS